MPFDMYGDVILTRDLTERELRAGDVGTVVEMHVVPGVPEQGYSVESFDMTAPPAEAFLKAGVYLRNWTARQGFARCIRCCDRATNARARPNLYVQRGSRLRLTAGLGLNSVAVTFLWVF